ncbi:MAG TPA: hypothetical protein VL306_00455 [Methylomirabilota bacterium]|jgi:hypothetical protein|nr:hypothetical protein [Methylomirabilota bacterium]
MTVVWTPVVEKKIESSKFAVVIRLKDGPAAKWLSENLDELIWQVCVTAMIFGGGVIWAVFTAIHRGVA